MTLKELLVKRIINQQLTKTEFRTIEKMVSWFGGIQAQDYISSRWALGIRLKNINHTQVEKEIKSKKIIRTWLMRGTLHLAAARDVRWMLQLLGPRIIANNAFRLKQLELNSKKFSKFNNHISRLLNDGIELTRSELITALTKNKFVVDREQLAHLLQWASFERLICHGEKRGANFTFALLDECIPKTHTLTHENSLGELAKKYFMSRGPATVQDFVWWSGLTISDATKALEIVKPLLQNEIWEHKTYYFKNPGTITTQFSDAYFLPAFDEFVLAYKERSLFLNASRNREVITVNGIFKPTVILNGLVIAIWKPLFSNDKITIELNAFETLNKTQRTKIITAAMDYCQFMEQQLEKVNFT